MAVLYICGFSGDLPVIPCSDENIGHFERRNAYPFKFTCNSTGCSGVVVDCGSSHTFRRQSNSPFRGAKHFHTAAPMGRRCESAFALLSHQKVTKRLFSAEICDKIEDGITSGKGAILWELRFRA